MTNFESDSQSTLVTNDISIIERHLDLIPDINSGVVIVRLRRPSKTITVSICMRLLKNFKRVFPEWFLVSWRGLRLDITEQEAILCRLTSQLPVQVARRILPYDHDAFASEIISARSYILGLR